MDALQQKLAAAKKKNFVTVLKEESNPLFIGAVIFGAAALMLYI